MSILQLNCAQYKTTYINLSITCWGIPPNDPKSYLCVILESTRTIFILSLNMLWSSNESRVLKKSLAQNTNLHHHAYRHIFWWHPSCHLLQRPRKKPQVPSSLWDHLISIIYKAFLALVFPPWTWRHTSGQCNALNLFPP